MANTSIRAAFERMWQHVTAALAKKADTNHNHAASNITSGTLSSDRLSTVPIAKGGTGATTAAVALTNLGITATATELNYVDGVTSNIQTQLNNINDLASTNEDNIYKVNLYFLNATQCLSGVTSNVQTQIDNLNTGKVDKSQAGMTALFATGATVLSANQFGDELPDFGTAGRIFFKKVSG